MGSRNRQGFSFLELFVGITILFCGIIPIFWVLSSSNKEAKLTVQQVQATTHATNLLEAIRAVGYDAVSQFPSVMVQLEGGGAWRFPEDPGSITWAPVSTNQPTEDQKKAFDSFRLAFFDGKNPVVPEMEDSYRRYLLIRSEKADASPAASAGPAENPDAAPSGDNGMIGVVVRVEWVSKKAEVVDGVKGTDATQSVELRTVLGDPYRFLGGGG